MFGFEQRAEQFRRELAADERRRFAPTAAAVLQVADLYAKAVRAAERKAAEPEQRCAFCSDAFVDGDHVARNRESDVTVHATCRPSFEASQRRTRRNTK